MNEEMVIPGSIVANCSEWIGGEGVITQGSDIISVITGYVEFDADNGIVNVNSAGEGIRTLESGDVVIAEVVRLRESMVEANIVEIQGKSFRNLLPNQLRGQMHVTKLVDRYMHEAKDAMRTRDIIRAVVTETEPVIRLEIRGHEGCGVLHAICPDCGDVLNPIDDSEDWNVRCDNCGHESFRVLADSYGDGYGMGEELSELNRAGKRWGKTAESRFSKGPAARSTVIAADYRNDGSDISLMQFGDTGRGGGGGRNKPRGRKLFVGGIARGVETPQLKELFEAHGEVVDAIVMVDKETGNSRGFGFVTFANDEDAEKAISALNKTDLNGRKISVNDADSGKKSKDNGRKEAPAGSARMYVGGLPWETSDEGLKTLFSNFGTVHDVHVVTDRGTGKSKGFGFVTMPESEAKTAIVELNGSKFNGRKLKVQMSNSSGNKKSGRNKEGNQRSSREMQARREEGMKD